MNRCLSLNRSFSVSIITAAFVGISTLMCSNSDDNGSNSTSGSHFFAAKNLVSDTTGFNQSRIDTNLVNPWGLAGTSSAFYVADNGKGTVQVLNENGDQVRAPIVLPKASGAAAATPTGIVQNTTNGFLVPSTTTASTVIVAGEDGTISAWRSGDSATLVADRSAAGAHYTGLAIASDSGKVWLYAANPAQGRIDVFDSAFVFDSTRTFRDSTVPSGFAPYNIQNINGNLYVAYARIPSGSVTPTQGLGNGLIRVYNPRGTLVKNLVSQDSLDTPWGMAIGSTSFSNFSKALVVANYGDGRLTAYDTANGTRISQAIDSTDSALVIPGIRGLLFGTASINNLYFTAAPGDGRHGLFGYIQTRSK